MLRHIRMHPADELKKRTQAFAEEIRRLCEGLPSSVSSRLRDQLEAAGTAVGANYRAACRAKSHDDFTAKIATVVEEAEETTYWLDLLVNRGAISGDSVRELRKEAGELLAIMAASHKTARENQQKRRSKRDISSRAGPPRR
jgi:four helix bundle protein